MLTLVIPVYKNEGSIPDLLNAIDLLQDAIDDSFEAVFVIDGSPDLCYELLRAALPTRNFNSQLLL